MKPFVLDRYGRIVFPFNFLPELDFSVFETLEDFETLVRRDFEAKARSEGEIVADLEAGAYRERYRLLRDLAGHLFWSDRYAMTMYERRPTRWRRSEEHTSELQSRRDLVCRLLLEKKKKKKRKTKRV